MKVRFFLVDTEKPNFKGEPLAAVELEVVPRGFYVIDDVEYQFTGQPTFYIRGHRDGHKLEGVDLLVMPV